MRHKGRLKTWKEDKGFGFIEPSLGGPDVFVHIKSFQNRSRRPSADDLVIYEVMTDDKGRLSASTVSYAGSTSSPAKPEASAHGLLISSIASATFLLVVAGLGIWGRIPALVVWLYFGASVAAFFMYWHDKSAARQGFWRTKESSLLLCGLAGGWPGALIAQQLFRHKSAKLEFQVSFWITVLLNCIALGWAMTPDGASKISSLISGTG